MFQGIPGKSKFSKFLLAKNPSETMILAEGNPAQLRSAIVSAGPEKKLFIIDLPRTLSSESIDSILNSAESLKNGLIQSHMYGAGDNLLLINPPQIVIFSNRLFSSNISADRWLCYEIQSNKKKSWKNITKEVRRKAQEAIEVRKDIDGAELVILKTKRAKLMKLANELGKNPETYFGV